MLGDLSENGDYHAAKDSQGKMEARIRQLEAMLDDVEVLHGGPSEEVVAGVKVSLRQVISPGSPLGQALMGKKAGEAVTYQAPSGTLKVEIVSVGD